MLQYLVIIEPAGESYSAYVPDLPGCISTGESVDAVRRNMAEAIELHLDGLREDGQPIPVPSSQHEYVAVAIGD
jgi:predicted RNase H-like HicB family nuclease